MTVRRGYAAVSAVAASTIPGAWRARPGAPPSRTANQHQSSVTSAHPIVATVDGRGRKTRPVWVGARAAILARHLRRAREPRAGPSHGRGPCHLTCWTLLPSTNRVTI